jgi:uncharacterized protein YjiS (DUF1127 family)
VKETTMNQVRLEASRGPGTVTGLRGASWIAAALGEAAQRFEEWRRRMRSRQELMALGDDVLKDIGVGRSEAFREYSKPFWRN